MPVDVFQIVGSIQGGAFRVEEVVAEGGFAVVYRAHHEAFRASVALKCLKIPGTLRPAHQAEFLEKFRAEAELLFRLSADISAVVRPLHVGVLETPTGVFAPFIALEWLDGVTLDRYLIDQKRQGRAGMSPSDAVRLLSPVADALERAHRFPGPTGLVSILHRDVKPENVFLVDGARSAKILDFGIGTVKSAATQIVGSQSAGSHELTAFTPGYAAPEQWVPKRYGQTGRWTDVWGLAITTVEAIVGRPPIDGDHAAMMGAALDPARRPTPRAEGVSVPDEVERVLANALAVDPRDRYQDIATFWNALHGALGITRSVSRRPAATSPVAPAAPGTAPVPSKGAEETMPAPRRVPTLIVDSSKKGSLPDSAPRAAEPAVARAPAAMPRGQLDSSANYLIGNTISSFDDDDDALQIEPVAPPARVDDLDGVGLSPRSRPVRAPARFEPIKRQHQGVDSRFRTPVKLVIAGIAIMAADFAYTLFVGEAFQLGPVRSVMVAGPLVVLGVVLGALRLFAGGDE